MLMLSFVTFGILWSLGHFSTSFYLHLSSLFIVPLQTIPIGKYVFSVLAMGRVPGIHVSLSWNIKLHHQRVGLL